LIFGIISFCICTTPKVVILNLSSAVLTTKSLLTSSPSLVLRTQKLHTTDINAHQNIILKGLNMSVEVLKDIRKELKELRLLYKELVEKLIPTEQPTPEERKAIEEKDQIANEKELMKTLGKAHVRHKD